MLCTNCREEGHNKRTCKKDLESVKHNVKKSRGKNCLKNGLIYQGSIYNKLKNKSINDNPVEIEQVEKSDAGPDIVIKYENLKIGVEVKNRRAFEGGSRKMKFDESKSRLVFDDDTIHSSLLNDRCIYEGKNLPYYEGKKSNEDYEKVKDIFTREERIDIESDKISKYYTGTGVYYIQIERFGLYHTGNDILKLGVPFFECKQCLRIRTSKHKKRGIPTDVVGDLNYDKKTLTKSIYDIDGNMPPNIKQME